ncbi:MAG: hypothetical protein M0Q88_01240 [Bacilli bacterium]|nr:hypothetical protein [Bacilli bacterium]
MTKNYDSLLDAFRDLNSVADEEVLLKPKVRKIVREAKEFNLRAGKNEIEDAKKFMHESELVDEIEVIDVNADSLEHVKDNIDYVGQAILQCIKCHTNRFIEFDQLETDPDNDELYNTEEECPNCHVEGKGFELIGQVGKVANEAPADVDTDTSAEVAVDNDQKTPDEVAFENDVEDVDSDDAEEVTQTETETGEEDVEAIDLDTELDYVPEEEDDGMTTTVTDDTDDEEFELPQLGDLFDSDKVRKDDTVEDEEDEDEDKEEVEEAKQVKTTKPLTKKLRLPTRESLDKLRAIKLNLTEELVHRIILPESINKVIVTNTDNKKIYEGMMSELPIKLIDSAIDGFNVGNGYLSCNIDLDEHEVELPLAKILNSFNDDETTKIIIWDCETDRELFNGSKQGALARFGHCQFVSLDAPKTLCIKVKDAGEDIYTDNIEDQSLSAEDELCDKIFTVNDLAKYNVDSPRSEEFWIKESIHNREDLEVLFEKYVKNTDDKKLIEQFKKITGYKDELDEMLEKHDVKVIDQKDINEGVSADQFKEILNLATKLGMTLFQLQAFARKHGDVEGIELLDLLRKKASEQNNQVTEDLNKEVVSFKTRKDLSEAVSKLRAENKKYKVQRSLKENYRYDLITEAADPDFEFEPGEYEEYIEEAKNLAKQIKTWDVQKCEKLFNEYEFFKTEPQDEAEQIIFDALDARLTELYGGNSKKDFRGKMTDILKDVKTYSLKKAEELYYDVFGFDAVEPKNEEEQKVADALINRIEQISTKKPVIAGEALEEDFEIEEINESLTEKFTVVTKDKGEEEFVQGFDDEQEARIFAKRQSKNRGDVWFDVKKDDEVVASYKWGEKVDLSESIDRTLLAAVQDAYGFNKKEALNWIKTATKEEKEAIVKGFKQDAKKNFYEDVENEEEDEQKLSESVNLVTTAKKLKQMFDGDPQYFDEAADIIIYWYEREDNIAALKDPELSDILDLLDAASSPSEREIVAKAIGPDADFIFDDEDEDDDDWKNFEESTLYGEDLELWISRYMKEYHPKGITESQVKDVLDDLRNGVIEGEGKVLAYEEAEEFIQKFVIGLNESKINLDEDEDLEEEVNIKPFFSEADDEIDFDAELFDEELNKYFDEAYEDTVIFKTMGGAVDVKGNVVLEGIIRSENSEANVKFTLTPKTEINESLEKHNLTETLKNTLFKVTNNLSEEVFEFKINDSEK